MQSTSNQPAPFDAIRLSLQAREILERLDASGGIGNDDIFYRWLGTIGLAVASSHLAELLDRLEREAFISCEMVERIRVLRLTRRGQEVARGVEAVEWIAPPEPHA
jgi:DNA-binding MarR family transcriptional regulator